jgi:cytochrome c
MPVLASLIALALSSGRIQSDVTPQNVPPRDVWAFRSVLDNRARIATVALAKDFWIAYDATNCGLYKFWKGDVNFEGAVYTTVHGPQPTSKGGEILGGKVDASVWKVDGKEVKPRYRGHRLLKGSRIEFVYELPLASGQVATVTEEPQLLWRGEKPVGLTRTFKSSAPTADIQVLTYGRAASFSNFFVNGQARPEGDREAWNGIGAKTTWSVLFNPALSQPAEEELFATTDAPQGQGNIQKGDVHAPGLSYRAYQIEFPFEKIPSLVPNQTPNVSRQIPNVDLKNEQFGLKEHFLVSITGWLKVEEGALYEFRMNVDDGARLFLNGERIINFDGMHLGEQATGSMDLEPGLYPLRIDYFQNEGPALLTLDWKLAEETEWKRITNKNLETVADEVGVVAPGFKKVMDAIFPQRPGDGRPEVSVHPSFDLTTPRPADFNPRVGGMSFRPNGHLVLCTWDPDGAVYDVEGVQTGDPSKVVVKRIAAGLSEPLGIEVVGNDIFVAQKQEITRLRDTDKDGIIDEYYALSSGFGVTPNFHEFTFGFNRKGDYLYTNLALGINTGGRSTDGQNIDRGRVMKTNIKTGDYEFIARGLRTPNGTGMNGKGELFITDNQGDWLPSCKLLEVIPGAFYGNRSVEFEALKGIKELAPAVWFPQGEIGNSVSQPGPFEYGPYKGQMMAGDVTYGGLRRIFLEKVNGRYQGTVFRLTQGLEAGINRVIVGPDKAMYVGGIGSTGNWGQEGKERYGLQRLAYNGKTTFEMLKVLPAQNGAEIEFTEPVQANLLPEVLSEWEVRHWHYVPTIEYGGPKVGEERLPVKSVTWNKTRTKVFLEFNGVKPEDVVYFRLPMSLRGADGQMMWANEAWSTVNVIPNRVGTVQPSEAATETNSLSAEEKAAGFELLFDGKNITKWRKYRGEGVPKGWQVADQALVFIPGLDGGDLATKEQYGDFELRLDWRVQAGGNSGIMLRSRETRGASYETATECQVLDDAKHPDGKNPLTSAGSAYGLYAPAKKMVNPANTWNHLRVVYKGAHVEHWLNGVKIVEYEIGSADFLERLKKSKFNGWPEYAKYNSGHIVLQDHGNLVAYKNIRIRKL